ncbi:MAG: rane-bound O-acyltransferase family protein, partial [Akkermansiaceae bacterium]|nr:rane-bound O-acyltransferase family protein [Akkermansiaceae bacterium]
MLFNSYTFLLVFLPLAVLGFQLLRHAPRAAAFAWLVAASLFFYGYWNPIYLPLVIGACTVNFFLGEYLSRHQGTQRAKWVLAGGVTANLLLLGYYKYTGFLQVVIGEVTGTTPDWAKVVLPLGISFFTFQKIAYLVDASRGRTKEYRFLDFLLFVFFFPQLIAGPIVHHGEIMPQFRKKFPWGTFKRDFAIGLGILALGLFKKVVVADRLSSIASPLFDLAGSGSRHLTMAEAWTAAVSYSLQLYFDFSGYTDMAIGAARFFG